MWDILDTKLYAILSNPLYKSSSDSEGELKDVYKEFMETLILYLDTENDNRKRIRTLNITQVEFEMIKSLELSYGNKGDILKIVYSDKVLLLINKELELIYRQMQYPKYFINIIATGILNKVQVTLIVAGILGRPIPVNIPLDIISIAPNTCDNPTIIK